MQLLYEKPLCARLNDIIRSIPTCTCTCTWIHTSSDPAVNVVTRTETKTTTKTTRTRDHDASPPKEIVEEMTAEYRTVSRDEPYEVSVEHDGDATRERDDQKEQRLRYGGLHRYVSLHNPEGGDSAGSDVAWKN